MRIVVDDLSGPEIAALLNEHLAEMRATSPPESVHALDLDGLRQPAITFWSLWDGGTLAGCVALKALDATHAEIKSMRTAKTQQRRGIGRRLMEHLMAVARERGYQRLSLETGSMAFFIPARTLYAAFGFAECSPFGSYQPDPNRVFMTRLL